MATSLPPRHGAIGLTASSALTATAAATWSSRCGSAAKDRLPKEFKLAGIDTVEAANRWLRGSFIAEHS
jgi:hypothetical protein